MRGLQCTACVVKRMAQCSCVLKGCSLFGSCYSWGRQSLAAWIYGTYAFYSCRRLIGLQKARKSQRLER